MLPNKTYFTVNIEINAVLFKQGRTLAYKYRDILP
jgi:hypothetical protein